MNQNNEMKWKVYNTSSSVSTSISTYDLTTLAQGVTENTRIGSAITVRKLIITEAFTVSDPTNIVRSSLISWKLNNTVDSPQIGEIFSDVSYPYTSAWLPIKPSVFKVIDDIKVPLDTYNPLKLIKREFKLNHRVAFDTGVNTGKDHLYLILCSDSAAVAHPGYVLTVTMLFTDD